MADLRGLVQDSDHRWNHLVATAAFRAEEQRASFPLDIATATAGFEKKPISLAGGRNMEKSSRSRLPLEMDEWLGRRATTAASNCQNPSPPYLGERTSSYSPGHVSDG